MPTPKQREVLDAIEALTRDKGFAPTTRELAEHLDMWNSAVGRILQRLREEGYVTWEEGRARTLAVTEPGTSPTSSDPSA